MTIESLSSIFLFCVEGAKTSKAEQFALRRVNCEIALKKANEEFIMNTINMGGVWHVERKQQV